MTIKEQIICTEMLIQCTEAELATGKYTFKSKAELEGLKAQLQEELAGLIIKPCRFELAHSLC